jgi:hypothetical protein
LFSFFVSIFVSSILSFRPSEVLALSARQQTSDLTRR